jgi:hypothetical protein
MESLENKLERLTPVQRQEVEDFVDFLVSRSGMVRDFPGAQPVPSPLMNGAPPPLTLIEPVHIAMTVPFRESEQPYAAVQQPSSPVPEEPAGVIQEITVGGDDGIARDYLDYGQFEQVSPANEAVRKVKEKMSRRGESDKAGHILEWID